MTQSDGANAEDHDSTKRDGDLQGADGAEHHAAGAADGDGPEGGGQDGGKSIKCTQSSIVASPDRESGIEPFLAAAAAGERAEHPRQERPFYSTLLDYSAHAAMIVGLLGFAWTLSAHTGKQQQTAPVVKSAGISAANAAPAAETAELRLNTQKMAAEISALRQSLDALRSGMHGDLQRQDKAIDQIKALASNLDGVKLGLSATKTETTAALAALSNKIDHLQRGESSAKIQQVTDRLDKLERETADQTVTASLPPSSSGKAAQMAVPPVKPPVARTSQAEYPEAAKKAAAAAEAEVPKKPQIIPEWVVREVDDGVAIVESKRGQLAVEPGGTIPGAGVVKSIERHGGSWTVTTSKGQLAYVPVREQAPRDPRYYRPGPDY